MAKHSRNVNVNLAVDAFDILDDHCRKSGQTKTVALERMIRACYGPRRKLTEDDIADAQIVITDRTDMIRKAAMAHDE